MVTILMILVKMVTLVLLKKRYFEIKVIFSVHDVTNKILSRGSNYIEDVAM